MGESFAITGDTGNFVISSTEDITREPEVRLYPNPVSEQLILKFSSDEAIVEIFSVEGVRVTSQEALKPGEGLSVSALSSGFYFLCIHAKGTTITKRFIKE